jgi:uncharacterized protein YecT (DUF1311 family)
MLKIAIPIFALMLCPAAVLAKPLAAEDYSHFVLTGAASKHMRSNTYVTCMVEAGGVTSSMRECIGAEYQRIDVRLNASYKRTLARLSKTSQAKLRGEERFWLKTRSDRCEADLEEDKGGTIWLIEMDNCALQELIRRTLWIERKVS